MVVQIMLHKKMLYILLYTKWHNNLKTKNKKYDNI